MMIEEFEARTGIYPSIETYQVIEDHYYQFEGNKDDFCKAFKENRDGIAQRIQRDANNRRQRMMRASEAVLEHVAIPPAYCFWPVYRTTNCSVM